VYRDTLCVFTTPDLGAAIAYIASELHFAVAQHADTLFVHAGGVGWKGRTIVIPATTHGGKTTLVAALVQQGATYYSDEYAVFQADGRVRSYPKPLSVRLPEGGVRLVNPSDLGVVGRRTLPVGMAVFTRYRPGGHWRPRPLSPAASMLGLLQNTVMARARAEDSMSILQRAVAGCTGIRTARGDAEEAAQKILKSADW